MTDHSAYTGLEVAIIGIACSFPGAGNWRQYWNNLASGVESIRRFSPEELRALGRDDRTTAQGNFVGINTRLKNKDAFDAAFFDYSPLEASLMNPVHRLFHTCVWEALEDAGYVPGQINGMVSLYAGASDDLNWKVYSMLQNSKKEVDDFTLNFLNNKDHLATLVSYKLDLRGPSFVVNTACSTSLATVSMACKGLLMGEAKMAVAGGVSVMTQQQYGYYYQEGMIYSPDGYCRAFDKDAAGTVGSEGAGVVVLKRLADAMHDGDHIYAVIKGSAVNNDGGRKVGYTAPSVEGQAECIRAAQKFAKVAPETISYVETHGTGTRLGDPIELAALNMAFRSDHVMACAIGAVKTNIGHTDAAAGIAGLIKTALSLKHRQIPASLHYKAPNPEIAFNNGPFYVNTALKKWGRINGTPARAGVSSFGIGGTNVHIILEEAPQALAEGPGRKEKILTVSARTPAALNRYIDDLHLFLQQEPLTDIANLCYTLQEGRKAFPYRAAVVFGEQPELMQALADGQLKARICKSRDRSKALVFLFPGQGAQYADMCKGLYANEPVFREVMDKGFSIISTLTGTDLSGILFPEKDTPVMIGETQYAQPALFLVEYALARQLLSLGITPDYMIGHSIGEYTAACVSGVLSFEDALQLVVQRGICMQASPRGAMCSVAISEAAAAQYLQEGISLAAVNGPQQVVLSGDFSAVEQLKQQLDQAGIAYLPLHTSHAFHSGMHHDITDAFRKELEKKKFDNIQIPFLSNLTGAFIRQGEAQLPAYWIQHMNSTVRFSEGIKHLLSEDKELLFIEVGPGHTLTGLLKQHTAKTKPLSVNLVRSVKETIDDSIHFAAQIARLWSYGVNIDWKAWHNAEKRRRIPLPTYSFEPDRYPAEVDPFKSGLVVGGQAIQLNAAQPAEPLQTSKAERPDLSTQYVAPLTGTEEQLKALFEYFLGFEQIGVEDDFFELGMDSLKGMVVLKRIKDELGAHLTLKDFFGRQTIRQLAADIDVLKPARLPVAGALQIPQAPLQKDYPLSPSQRRSWVLSQINDSNIVYNMPGVCVFEGVLNREALMFAFKALPERHESLRTVFRENEEGEIRQLVSSPDAAGFYISFTDLRAEQDPDGSVKSAIKQEIIKPFDLVNGPLVRAVLYQVEDDKWVFVYITHHIICDAWSMGILMNELLQLYNAHVEGEAAALPFLRIQFKDYAVWQEEQLDTEALESHKTYWLKQFEGTLPLLQLPGDRPRPSVKTYNGGTFSRHIAARFVKGLKVLSHEQGGTLFMGLMAAINTLLYRYTSQEDIIIGFPIAGRDHEDLEGQIGFFADTLALRTRFSGTDSFRELFENIKVGTLGAYEHRQYPFDALVDALELQRDMSRCVLFDVMVVLQKSASPGIQRDQQMHGLKVSEYEGGENPYTAFDLLFNFMEDQDALKLQVEFNSDIFNRNTVQQLVNHLEQLLGAIIAAPDQPIRQLDFLHGTEKEQLLAVGNSEVPVNKSQQLDFSFFYFGNISKDDTSYQLLTEGARYADANGYAAVWTPERHFHPFGGPFPNPAVLASALAVITRNISIRAGSIVVPLHHPVRIAEDWAVVDNLSGGRAGIACASGWHANDFIFFPDHFRRRNEVMYQTIDTIKKLWCGESVSFPDGNGFLKETEIFPKPVQQTLPLWITTAGNIETFISAGRLGANILTNLLNGSLEDLALKIAAYRKAYKDSGHGEHNAKVALMLHTYIGEDMEDVNAQARKPFVNYLKSSLGLMKNFAVSMDHNLAAVEATAEELEEMLDYSFERYVAQSSLIGTMDTCMQMLENAAKAGVDEIACLVDFGVAYEAVMKSFSRLTVIKDAYNARIRDSMNTKASHEQTIVGLFEEQAGSAPDAIALKFEESTLSYRELNELSNQLARYLSANVDIRQDDLVGIRLNRSQWTVIAILGVLKSGAAYVPIDPEYPTERIEYIIADSHCKTVIDEQLLNSFRKEQHKYNTANPAAIAKPDDLAYVIYTSGSTGQPKGVMITHRNVVAFIDWCKTEFSSSEFDIVFAATSVCFDLSVFEILYPLCTGKKLRILSNALAIPSSLNTTEKVLLNIVPGVAATLFNDGLDLGAVTVLNMAGEPLQPYHVRHLDCERIAVRNLYGPTEATIYSTVCRIKDEHSITIGGPIKGTTIYVLNTAGQLQPPGVIGEICIGGQGLSRGYLHKPALTAEKFVPNPFAPGTLLYRTGDLGRWLPDGNLQFIGRADEQVKIRGYRVEPGEAGSILQCYPGMDAAVVIATQGRSGDHELVAYMVSGEALSIPNIRAWLAAKLPAYLLPAYYIQLEALPLTPNGKIDRKRLPAPDGIAAEREVTYLTAGTKTEAKLVLIWQEILDREPIGIKDNFFELGGHSLKATRIISRIRREFDVTIDLLSLFNHPTVEAVAAEIDRIHWANGVPVEQEDVERFSI